jgi:class 3 adenylate cyclase
MIPGPLPRLESAQAAQYSVLRGTMVEVPSGTVTLLFTDVEGSTRLLKQLRQEYGQLLADHHRLMRSALEHHAGREMDTQGKLGEEGDAVWTEGHAMSFDNAVTLALDPEAADSKTTGVPSL